MLPNCDPVVEIKIDDIFLQVFDADHSGELDFAEFVKVKLDH